MNEGFEGAGNERKKTGGMLVKYTKFQLKTSSRTLVS